MRTATIIVVASFGLAPLGCGRVAQGIDRDPEPDAGEGVQTADAGLATPDAQSLPPADAELRDVTPTPDAATATDVGQDAADAGPCNGQAPGDYGLSCGCAGDGKIQCDGTCSQPDDTCIPTGNWYLVTSNFLGDKRPLDTYAGTVNEPFIAPMPCCSGQNWKVTAIGDGSYRLTNMFLMDGRALAVSADGKKLIMGVTGNDPAQSWKIRATGAGWYRLTNRLLGDRRSLDIMNNMAKDLFMGDTGNYSGQFWKFTKQP